MQTLEISRRIGRQLRVRGLIDEIDLHIAPVLLGDGSGWSTTRWPVRLELVNGNPPAAAGNGRRRPFAPQPPGG